LVRIDRLILSDTYARLPLRTRFRGPARSLESLNLSQEFSGGHLTALGWSNRVAALFNEVAESSDRPARVVRVERGASVVIGPEGDELLVHLGAAEATVPAVGDWVVLDGDSIRAVLPRWAELSRRDVDQPDKQVLAADIDLVLITTPADRPSANRIERELALAWDSGARPVVIFTKYDVAGTGALDQLRSRLVGVDVIPTSTKTGQGVDEVASLIHPDLTAVLLGPSGAGKSSLVNALLGEDRLSTGRVREGDSRGRHTTTSRQLVAVPGGGVLIDTPGLRSLSLGGEITVEAVFPEIEELSAGCRFSDCSHRREPGCAVLAALRNGELDKGRFASFQKLEDEIAAEELRQQRHPSRKG
jgi:ribosome biogenesis GTPase